MEKREGEKRDRKGEEERKWRRQRDKRYRQCRDWEREEAGGREELS